MKKQTEQKVIDQLHEYRRIVGRIKVLQRQPVGMGYTVSAISQDDQLQELHRQLKGLPSYMYLNKREQDLEAVAHEYLAKYPAGIRNQYREISNLHSEDPADEEKLRDLTGRIRQVLEARTGMSDKYEHVLERISELQDLEIRKAYIDNTLEVLDELKPGYGRLLRLRYAEDRSADEVSTELCIARSTFHRWHGKAVAEYGKLAT